MIVYNVTINIETSVHEEWIKWMKEVHIPEVMATGIFTHFRFLHLLSKQDDETGETYAIQYDCPTLDNYNLYQKEYAPALQAKTQAAFGGKFVAFRTLLETT